MNASTTKIESGHPILQWIRRRGSSLATLIAGVSILLISAYSGLLAQHEEAGIDWLELSIYLLAVIVVATQGGRLIRACAELAMRPVQRLRKPSKES